MTSHDLPVDKVRDILSRDSLEASCRRLESSGEPGDLTLAKLMRSVLTTWDSTKANK